MCLALGALSGYLADDVVASVHRMYADDYSLVKRLAGLGLDELLTNATI